jgi:hypothetical protein
MRYLVGFMCVLALGVMGCSETAGTGGSGGSAGDGGMGGDGGAGGTATLSILVIETLAEGGIRPVEGLQLCETDTANCMTTDANGNAAIELPVNREVSYTMEKEGFIKHLRADVLAGDEYRPITMSTDAQSASQYELVMSPYPMEGTGTIFVQAFSDELGVLPIAGATFELIGAAGKAYYTTDEEGNWSLDLTATTSRGVGGFVEVSPGEHELRISGTVENCQVLRGWPSDSENTMRFPVREGYLAITRWYCPLE